jgi:hypothetical protein
MISLESGDWQRLQHAYGPASNIPALLRQLAQDSRPKSHYKDEPWFSLWSALCHQGDVYNGSYAAVSHIVQLGITALGPIDNGFFLLPACIEVARHKGRGPDMPSELADSYFHALRGLHECAYRHAADDWDSGMAQSVAAALAAAKSQHAIAEAVIILDDDMIKRIVAGDL